MEAARQVLTCAAGIAALILCSSFSVARAQVATITCSKPGSTAVSLTSGEAFVLICNSPFNLPSPPEFTTRACPGPGADCGAGRPYAELFPSVKNHMWVIPQDTKDPTHTWTAPTQGLPKEKTVFSVGCVHEEEEEEEEEEEDKDDKKGDKKGDKKKKKRHICSVDVTVSSAVKTVVSGVLLAMCSLVSLVVL